MFALFGGSFNLNWEDRSAWLRGDVGSSFIIEDSHFLPSLSVHDIGGYWSSKVGRLSGVSWGEWVQVEIVLPTRLLK